MPVTPDAFQGVLPKGFDFYLLVIERDFGGPDPLYGSYIGGSSANEHVDGGTSRFDKNGVVYQSVCGGCGGFSDFPTTPGAFRSNSATNCNNLIFKFDFELIPNAEFTVDNNLAVLHSQLPLIISQRIQIHTNGFLEMETTYNYF